MKPDIEGLSYKSSVKYLLMTDFLKEMIEKYVNLFAI
jgi:hypothetical protein